MPENESLPLKGQMLDDCLKFLDDLRESGETNMFAAVPWVRNWGEMNGLDLSRQECQTLLAYWMDTFGERHGHGQG